MTHSIKFSLADDAIVRNLKGEEVVLASIKDQTEYPIWGVVLLVSNEGAWTLKQLCKGELKIKKIHHGESSNRSIRCSNKIEMYHWDTEFRIGTGEKLVSMIWNETNLSSTKFDMLVTWDEEKGFLFRQGTKKFLFTLYNLKSTDVYGVDFEVDITALAEKYSSSYRIYPCIPYVQTLLGQEPSTYSIHKFPGLRGGVLPRKPSRQSLIRKRVKKRRKKRRLRLSQFNNEERTTPS